MTEWALAFLLTEAIEVPVYTAALAGRTMLRRLVLAAAASLLTHPWVWMFVLRFGYPHYWLTVAGSELFAVAVESLYLSWLKVRRPLVWALVANGLSLVGGMAYYGIRFDILAGP